MRLETKADLRRETAVIKKIMRQFQCKSEKLPDHNRMDFALMRGRHIVAFAEIKVRTFPMDQYPTMLIDVDKVSAARRLTADTGLPAFLFVQWTNALAYIDFQAHFETRLGGRTDRDRVRDYGLMAHFRTQEFTKING